MSDQSIIGTKDEHFLPGVEGIIHSSPGWTRLLLPLILMGFLAVVILWLLLSKVEVIAVAQGKIAPIEPTQLIQTNSVRTIREIVVKGGERVAVGSPLIEFESGRDSALFTQTREALEMAEARLRRLETSLALLRGEIVFEAVAHLPPGSPDAWRTEHAVLVSLWKSHLAKLESFESGVAEIKAKRAAASAVLTQTREQIPFVREEVSRQERLLRDRAAAQKDVTAARRQLIEMQNEAKVNEATVKQSDAELISQADSRASYEADLLRDTATQIAEQRQQVLSLRQDLVRTEGAYSDRLLRSPIRGYVHNLAVTTRGGVAQPAEVLMEVVPAGALEIRIETDDGSVASALEPGATVQLDLPEYQLSRGERPVSRVRSVSRPEVGGPSRGDPPAGWEIRVRVDEPLTVSGHEPVFPSAGRTLPVIWRDPRSGGERTVLGTVVEQEMFMVEAMIQNKDRGFVSRGQRVRVKLDAFDFSKYGALPGELMSISEEAYEDQTLGAVFKAEISLDYSAVEIVEEGERKLIRLSPGMTAVVDIQTGERRLGEYILAPYRRHVLESFRGR